MKFTSYVLTCAPLINHHQQQGSLQDAFFGKVNFIGTMGSEDRTARWTAWGK